MMFFSADSNPNLARSIEASELLMPVQWLCLQSVNLFRKTPPHRRSFTT
jgi:recombinational DNA repair ATPase RecF